MNQPPRDPADWSALQSLLEQALALPVSDRAVWLEALPPRHEPLREPLRRLLEVQAGLETRPFIDHANAGIEGLTPVAAVIIGDLIGPYRLLQELGDGGMGSVWLAERADGAMKRKVALKLPRMVWARDLATRMARERDILGSLEHPRIARLYDAGVDQLGRPFLALEYVEGERIDRYCDRQRLGVSQRIGLFLQVLEAVQYAHTNLVLHRDLKPANVLVNQRGEIRLLDFGIAKLLDERTSPERADAHSRSLSRAMTPRYASPEQVRQLRLSLASDVYSLGVMLHELLVGTTPYVTHNGSRAELEIAITEGRLRAPSRSAADAATAALRQSTPSRLARALRGELDAVLLKALARNPSERYPSAEALRADLERWLAGHPVHAKRPSRLLALRKFVTRNAWSVAVGGTAVCAVLTAGLIAIAQAREARLESRRATATRDFLLGLFENANPELHGGRELTARDLLLAGEASLDSKLNTEMETSTEVLRVMANAWAQIGDFEKMSELAAKRSALAREADDLSLRAEALIDEARIAARIRDIRKIDMVLAEIRDLGVERTVAGESLSDLLWLRGFRDLSSGRNREALDNFSRAAGVADGVDDVSRSISALYGVMLVHSRAGDRWKTVRAYRAAMQKARSEEMVPGERLRRSFELTAQLFEAGAYKDGWVDMDRLLGESVALYGEAAASQQLLYLYWMNWAMRVDEVDLAQGFLSRFIDRRAPDIVAPESTLDLEWRLTEARLLVLRGDYTRAQRIVETLLDRNSAHLQRRSIGLLEAEILVRSRSPLKALQIFERNEWQLQPSETESDLAYWRFYRHWVSGSALDKANRSAEAVEQLQRAERYAADRFGKRHPRAVAVTLSCLVAQINTGHAGLPWSDAEKTLVDAMATLRESYPERSRKLAAAIRLSDALKAGDQKSLSAVARSISEESPFL